MMKMILAPTDFSKTARNAVDYAAEIAKRTRAKLVILHAYHPEAIISEAPIDLPSLKDIEKDCMNRLKKTRYHLLTKHSNCLEIEIVCINGLAGDVITSYSKEHGADLVIMGTQGVGFLEEKLMGSVTSEVIKKPLTQVLSIPANLKFKSIKKIVLATDYGKLEKKTVFDQLKSLARTFKPHIYILNVRSEENSVPNGSQSAQGLLLEHLLEDVDHSFHAATNSSVVKGINEFVNTRKIDLVVMLPRQRSFLQNLFKKSNSKTMVFHTETPLLTIPA